MTTHLRLFQPNNDNDLDENQSSLLSLNELKVLLFARKTIAFHKDQALENTRAKNINHLDASHFLIEIDSDLSFVVRAISDNKISPNHLLNNMVRLGWKNKLNKTQDQIIDWILSDYYYMFGLTKSNLLFLRKGFRGPEKNISIDGIKSKPILTKQTTLSDLVYGLIQEHNLKSKDGITCIAVCEILEELKISCSFRAINAILQNNKSLILRNNRYFLN
jgi:hypothetical protein